MTRSAVAPKRAAPEVSVVIPCFNEEENVAAIAGAVATELAALKADYEIIFIDNASTDDTVERVMALCAADTRIKLIANNRNYGQMRSPTHGIYQATGRGVIAMCADFQDPPALIGRFVTRWREGASIVLGVRASEKTSLGLGLARGLGLVTWTFDPMRVANARLNLRRLGAVAREFLPNFYGTTSSALHHGLATDRLLVRWELDSQRVARRGAAAEEFRWRAGLRPGLKGDVETVVLEV